MMTCCQWPSLLFFTALYISKSILLLNAVYSFVFSMIIYIFFGGWRWLRIIFLTLPRDIHALVFLLKMKIMSRNLNNKGLTLYDVFKKTVRRKGEDKTAIYFEDQKWSFKDLLELTDRVASVYQKLGIKRGDRIGLFMHSHAVYPFIWLGATKIGAATGLLNFSLKGKPLEHSIHELKPKLIVTSEILFESLTDIELPSNCRLLSLDDQAISPDNFRDKNRSYKSAPNTKSLDQLIAESDMSCTLDHTHKPTIKDTILFIYTSGTTGYPKAAVISLARYLLMTLGPNHLLSLKSDTDVIYNSLPLYHTAGGMAGMGQNLFYGIPMAIRRKFSASQFWSDCIKYNVTVVQYVGELCRYLLAQPPKPEDTAHKVRLAFGNGVRRQVWIEFVKRFGVKQIGELYGATESNANFVNSTNTLGAIGFSSVIVPWAYPCYLIKTDPVTEEVSRDPKTGLCIQCDYNEPGQLVGAIRNNDALRNFDGYTNSQASSKKIIRDVFKKGDTWFLSGDLLEQDDLGYFYFRDRLGDTFRWRGENVSTNEVEAVIMSGLNLQCCVVYGVEVPGCEGKAGMLALGFNHNDIVNESETSKKLMLQECQEQLELLNKTIQKELPAYAQPLFVRFVDQIDTTGTFKLRKIDLVKAGFDPAVNKSHLVYFLNSETRKYQELIPEIFDQIICGQIKF